MIERIYCSQQLLVLFAVEADFWIAIRFRLQDYNLYGGGGRMYRNSVQKSFSEYSMDPLTPPRSYAVKKNGDEDDSPRDFSPGLLDIHSFDTELLPQVYSFSFRFNYRWMFLFGFVWIICLWFGRFRPRTRMSPSLTFSANKLAELVLLITTSTIVLPPQRIWSLAM